jgi:fructose-bisphosphate aldolase class II
MCDLSDYGRFIHSLRAEIENVRVPVCLHLDHATDLDDISEAIDVGFTSVMIDASQESYEENVARTLKTIALTRFASVSVEAELGHVGSGEDYFNPNGLSGFLTDPAKAVEFVKECEIDALAVSFGNVHGAYKGEPNLDYHRLQELNEQIQIPLVLHGTSGLSNDAIKKTINLGIRKINLYTDIISAYMQRSRMELLHPGSNPITVAAAQAEGVVDVFKHYLSISGSIGKAVSE